NADSPERSAHRKDRALHFSRVHPGLGHSDRGLLSISRPDAGQHFTSFSGHARLHRREPRDGHHVFDDRKEPTASDADGFLRFSPINPAFRFHVSVSRHAALGPNRRRSFSAHPFSADRSRHSFEGQRHNRCYSPALADRALRSHRFNDRNQTLPANFGLETRTQRKALIVKLFVIGATGRTGSEVVEQAVARGHQVTAFVRSPESLKLKSERLTVINGDVMDEDHLANAMQNHDAVASALGPREVFKPSSLLRESALATTRAMQYSGVKRLGALSAD